MLAPHDSRSDEAGSPAIALRRLLPHAEFLGGRDLSPSGCSTDPRGIEPGHVFLAPGDAADSASSAIDRGAIGIVADRPIPGVEAVQVIVADVRSARARLVQALHGDPAEGLPVVAITGGAGSEATCLFLAAILEAFGRRVGVLGPEDSADSASVASGLARLVDERCDIALVRPSDGALDDRALDGIALAGVIHAAPAPTGPTPERERTSLRRTARLVRALRAGGVLALDADDPDSGLLLGTNLDAVASTYGLNEPADVTADVLGSDLNGSRMMLVGVDRDRPVSLATIGEESLRAALAAAALTRALGASDGAIVAGLESIRRIPGRLEPIASGSHGRIFADRAADGPAVNRALRSLRSLATGDLVCVLAAHSTDSRTAEVVAAVEEGCDRVVLTASPAEGTPIDLASWLGHFRRPGRVRVSNDRASAVEFAMESVGPGDIVLLLGPSLDEWRADAATIRAWSARRMTAARRSA